MAEYIEYHPLKFWLDPASIAEIVAHIQSYLVANPINSTTEIETIIHDYLIAHPELIGGVDSVNGETGEVVLTADNINAGETITIKDVLDSLQDQIDDIVASIPSDYQQLIDDVSGLKSVLDWNGSYNADVSGILGSAAINNLSVTGKDGMFQYLFHIDIDAGIKYTFGIKLGDTPTQAVYFYIIDTDGNYIETSGSIMAINDAVVHTTDKTFESAHKNAVVAIKSKYDCSIDYAYAECSENLNTKLDNLFEKADEAETNFSDITAYKIESEPQLTTTSGYMSTSGEMKTGSNYAALSVSKGDIYSIRALTGSSVHAYVLIADGSVVDYYAPTDTWETAHNFDIIYKVPADGTLYINTTKSYYIGIRKLDIVCDCQPTVDDNAKGVSDALELIVSKNLFVPTEYNSGYRQGTSIVSNESYAYTKPIWLTAGTYLYTSVSSLVGNSDKVFLVDKFGVLQGTISSNVSIVPEEIGSISEYGIYSNRGINKFTLPNDGYVSLNLGYVSSTTKTSPQISNFMLVSGSLLTDWPKYEIGHIPYYTAKNATINGLSGLRGKRAIFDGDSICQGITVGDSDPTYGFGWAGRIGNANAMHWVNAGVGGGVITSESNPLCANKHSVVDNVDVLFASYSETDYYVFDGGCNDADLLGNAIQDPSVMGSFDPQDFSGSYDVTTFSGAFETIIYKAISHWKPNHIGYIIPQKMGNSNGYSATASNYRAYYERAIAICEKWGIPYLDLWNGCYLNPKNPLCRDSTLTPDQSIAQGYLYVDSQHLSAKGYDKITPMIEAWMKTI